MGADGIKDTILRYFKEIQKNEHHRCRSWEHCYQYFRSKPPQELLKDKTHAALQLGFYLASWGMYRGSGFLLQHDYKIHEGVVERIASSEFSELWQIEIGLHRSNRQYEEVILRAAKAIRNAYTPYGNATDTLATKVLLGTLACVPAYDRFFKEGFKRAGNQYTGLNADFISQVIQFCEKHSDELCTVQAEIGKSDTQYPLMKLVDMYFWQIGYEAYSKEKDQKKAKRQTD